MKKTSKKLSAEDIAKLAEQGKDVSVHFTNEGKMIYPIQKVNVDFTMAMLKELDDAASILNVSRQALIKVLLRQALDIHYLSNGSKVKSHHSN